MLGAIAGDICGSVFERAPIKTKQFELFCPRSTFTDDTVLTIAVAEVLLTGGDYAAVFRRYFRSWRDRGYGEGFRRWAAAPPDSAPASHGNGSAMRVCAIGWAFPTLQATLAEAERSAAVSHNHEEGIHGAQAVAGAVFLARTGCTRDGIRTFLAQHFGYDLTRTLDTIRPAYRFEGGCARSVPEALIAFLESTGTEDAIRNAVSLGGDSDTMAAIAGGVAEAFYGGVPAEIRNHVAKRLPVEFRCILSQFDSVFLQSLQRVTR